jgi:PPOX class probable F420-dependent enzyme
MQGGLRDHACLAQDWEHLSATWSAKLEHSGMKKGKRPTHVRNTQPPRTDNCAPIPSGSLRLWPGVLRCKLGCYHASREVLRDQFIFGGRRFRYLRMSHQPLNIPKEARTKLKSARVARLATVDQRCRPHLVPICFAYADGVFYTAVDRKPKRVSAKELARVRNIRTRPAVALIVDQYGEDWRRLWYVLVQGRATLVPPSARQERAKAIRQLRAKYAQYAAGMLPDDALIIRITPERIATWGEL